MAAKSKVPGRSPALSVIFFIPAFLLFLLWISISWRNGHASRVVKQDIFLNSFPQWMQHFTMIHLISIILCILAIAYASGSFKKRKLSLRILMMVIVMFSIIIILFNIVQLL